MVWSGYSENLEPFYQRSHCPPCRCSAGVLSRRRKEGFAHSPALMLLLMLPFDPQTKAAASQSLGKAVPCCTSACCGSWKMTNVREARVGPCPVCKPKQKSCSQHICNCAMQWLMLKSINSLIWCKEICKDSNFCGHNLFWFREAVYFNSSLSSTDAL